VAWSSKRQHTMSRSDAKDEYRAVANVVSEICWLCQVLQELHVKPRIFIENPNPCNIAIVPGSVAITYRTSHR
jgi:hypothetical protein